LSPDDLPEATAFAPFSVELSPQPGRLAVAVHGELDLATAPFFEAMLNAAINASDRPDVVEIDLGGLDFVDVAGSRALHSVAVRQMSRSHALRLRGPSRQARRLFAITGLDAIAELC